MRVDVGDHGGFLGGVFLAWPVYFEATTVPGVDGGFGAVECICVIDREFCAEDFCGTREHLGGRE